MEIEKNVDGPSPQRIWHVEAFVEEIFRNWNYHGSRVTQAELSIPIDDLLIDVPGFGKFTTGDFRLLRRVHDRINRWCEEFTDEVGDVIRRP